MFKEAGKDTQAARVTQMVGGLKKHFPDASAKLMVGGVTYTVADFTSLLESFVDLREATNAARATLKARLLAESSQAPPMRDAISAFIAYVKASFGNSPEELADFGIQALKARTSPSAEQAAAAVLKRAATREARHTMGSRQKKAVKGAVQVSITATPLARPQPVAASSQAAAGGTSAAAPATGGAGSPRP